MTHKQIIEQLKKLSNKERLSIVEEALRLIQQDFEGPREAETKSAWKNRLQEAAKSLLPDYMSDKELTSFTALDSEDFRETK